MTCVKHLPDGRFVSGGMDGKLCLWSEIGARCVELGQGHSGSVAKVEVSHDGSVCVSAGYDKTVRCWSTRTRRETASLEGHRAPVLELAWSSDGGLASGDRDGRMFLWDARPSRGKKTPWASEGVRGARHRPGVDAPRRVRGGDARRGRFGIWGAGRRGEGLGFQNRGNRRVRRGDRSARAKKPKKPKKRHRRRRRRGADSGRSNRHRRRGRVPRRARPADGVRDGRWQDARR